MVDCSQSLFSNTKEHERNSERTERDWETRGGVVSSFSEILSLRSTIEDKYENIEGCEQSKQMKTKFETISPSQSNKYGNKIAYNKVYKKVKCNQVSQIVAYNPKNQIKQHNTTVCLYLAIGA